VTKLVPFGAFVRVDEGIEGLVHISELAERHVEIPEQVQLVTQTATTGIPAGVVVAQHTGQGKAELAQQARNTGPAVAHVTHHQQGIGADLRQHRMVAVIPLIMEVTSDGDL
jgi:predicted RNA-binding protein with RPS1 domain